MNAARNGFEDIDYDPFAGGELQRVVPTTEPQREVWLADRLSPEASLAYNESVVLRLRGALDVDALVTGIQRLVDRHDALRATFGPDGETLCVGPAQAVQVERIDLSALPAQAREAAVAERARIAVDTAFALESGPLLRAELLRLGDDEHVAVMTAHHIVCDGWSWWQMLRELAASYAGATGHPAPALPEPVSFADYALAQATAGEGAATAADERYWLSRFEGEIPVLDLPLDRPRPARRGFASRREDVLLDPALVSDLKRMGARRGASLFAILLGGFATLLSRLAGQQQVVVGIPAAGQSVDGLDALVGHCVNLLPLCFDVDPAQPASALFDAAQDILLDAIEHQRYTFGTLLKKLQVDRDPSRLPLVSVMFTVDQAIDDDSHHFPGLEAHFATNPRTHENFELFVNAVQLEDGGLQLECQYNTGLFDGATIRRWMDGYEMLLRGAVQRTDAAVGSLPLVAGDTLAALAALQPAPTAYPAAAAMHQLFEAQCDRDGSRIALRWNGAALDYATLDARANRIAALLRARGVHRGALVGLAVDRGPDMVAALLAILKTGAGYVPLDPAFPEERLSYMVGDAGLAALVTQSRHAALFDLRGRPVLALDALEAELETTSPARVATAGAGPEDVAYVIYTSGSTGRPKGVQVPHRAVANFIASMQREPGITADDRLVAVTTLSFDIAVLELMLPLSLGAQVVLADRDTAMDGERLVALLRDSGATLMQATPATWRLLVDAGWQGPDGFRALCGGEPLPPDLARNLLARCAELWNLYGPTETTVWSTCARVEAPERGIDIGRPIANTSVWVLDPQGQPCPLGVPGELCIGGDGVTLGYLGRPDLTSERFVADPFAQRPGALLYRTGDRGRWRADGRLEHLGRLDFQVKVRGYRIELGEIEAALAACPGVGQSLVLVREDRPGDLRIVGYAVPRAGESVDEAGLLAQARRALPEYMVPQHVVVLAAMPQLPNGKIDRKGLPAPDLGARTAEAAPPRNDLERAIATEMARVLGMPEVGIHDNFFSLGGHSLLAAQLTSRLNRELGVALSLRALFDGPTVAQLAELVAGADSAPARAAIEHREDQSTAPLSLAQERLWLLEQFTPGQVVYNTPSGHRLRGPLDAGAFARAFDAVVQRQAVLRTTIDSLGGDAFQLVHDRVDSGMLPVVDLSAHGEEEGEKRALADMEALVAQPFDLSQPPLFRARLYRLADGHHLFFFLVHHAVWDGWSFDLLYSDLSECYAAELAGRAPDLPALPVSYGDFASWHRDFVQGPEYAAQLGFWRERLGRDRSEPMRAMPTDLPRKPGMSGTCCQHPIHVPRALVDRLHGVALGMDSTLFVTLLTAYFGLICAVGGQRDIIIATPVRGRNSDLTEHLMGYFTNLLPLRVRMDPGRPFAQTLREVKEVLLDSFANPDVRLEDLMRELSVQSASGGGQVLYHAMYSFQDVRQRPLDWGNVRHSRVELSDPGATQDLGLWVVENEGGLAGAVVYNSGTVLPATAQMLWERYLGMLESLADDPSQSLDALTRFDDGRPRIMGRVHDGAETSAEAVAVGAAAVSAASEAGDDDTLAASIRDIWEDLLGRDSIGPDEDFFALGGHSLQAVQMFHRISRATGINLPLATLFAAPTVRLLARAYRDAGAGGGAATTSADPWAPLVPIRAATSPDEPPLFFVHAVGGNVLNYHRLAESMGGDMAIYGLQAQGLDGRTRPLARIEDMARRYVAEIRSVQPRGPYHLAGGSMGGMIAYEMAQQLVAAGDEVALLALIDTSSYFGARLRSAEAQPSSVARRLRERLRGLSATEALRTLAGLPQARLAAARAQRRLAGLRASGAEVPHELRYAEIERVHLRAYRDYEVLPYPGAVTLFRAEQQHPLMGDDATLGWQGLVGALDVIDLPGSHSGIVEKPELPPALEGALRAARARKPATARPAAAAPVAEARAAVEQTA